MVSDFDDIIRLRVLDCFITSYSHNSFQVTHQYSFYLYVLPIVLFSILYNTPKFFELEVKPTTIYFKIVISGILRSLKLHFLTTIQLWGWLTSSRWPGTTTAATRRCWTCWFSSSPASSSSSPYKQSWEQDHTSIGPLTLSKWRDGWKLSDEGPWVLCYLNTNKSINKKSRTESNGKGP